MNAIRVPASSQLHPSSIESSETLWTPKTSVRQPPRPPNTVIETLRNPLLQPPKTSVLQPRRGFRLHTEDPEDGKKQWEFLATSANAGVLPAHSEPQQRVHTENDTRGLLPLPLHNGPNVGPWRRRTSRRRFRIFFLLFLISAVACFVWLKAPSLPDKLRKEQDREDEDDALQVFQLVYKYAEGPGVGVNISVPNSVQTLWARDLLRNKNRIPPLTTQGVIRPLLAAVSRHGNASALIRVKGNVFPDGLYYTTIHIGQPPRPYFVDVDTGSDLTWLQCNAPCTRCAQGPHSLYSPNGITVRCDEPICADVHHRTGPECPGDSKQCDYVLHYADKSSTMGLLVADVLSLKLTNRSVTEAKVAFGCGYDQQGNLATSPAMTDGLMGLGSASYSLPSQLARQGVFKNVVGHCLAGGQGGGYMFFGDNLIPSSGITWVPMLGKPTAKHYSVELQKVYYGRRGTVASSKYSVLIDSGTTFSFLMPELYTGFVASVKESVLQTELEVDVEDDSMPLCWRGSTAFSSIADVAKYFKTVTLSFGGVSGWVPMSSKLMTVSPENYLIISPRGNVCLAIGDARASGMGVSILGDIILRDQMVIYDNVQSRIGWKPGKCVS